MKPVFGYLRVSGRGQLAGDGEARQRETIERFCQNKGFQVIRWFFDGAVTGELDAADRDQYALMLSFCGPATTNTIIVERSDRLGRALTVCEIACEEARKSGITILEAASDTDLTNSDDPTRVLIRQVLGSLAEWNKNVMVKRLRAARERKRAANGHCEGPKPFGSRDNPDDEITLNIINALRSEDYSYREVALELTRRNRRTPEGKLKWSKSSVHLVATRTGPQEPQLNLVAGLAV